MLEYCLTDSSVHNILYACVCAGNDTLPSNCTDGDVRLVDVVMPDGGEGVVAGRVEICFNNVWGTICSSGFDDQLQGTAAVICQQLGFSPEGMYQ